MAKRRDDDGSETRTRLMDATGEVMLKEGYAAATSRRVAAEAGVQRALVHYYFPTMDDLYLAVLQRGTEAALEAQKRALRSEKPLRALWDMTIDQRGTQLAMEFMALGNHRKEIRAELAAGAVRFREAQIAALTYMLRERQMDGEPTSPDVVSILIAGLGRLIVLETGLGIDVGHPALLAMVDRYLDELDRRPGERPVDDVAPSG
ncbi:MULTISPECIES: TetR/AcrR family transcriptional regulator [unclassified Mycobacterium]|uniref:TetR/AcrR family transcriptional regulator n=1 Tax=unclassified Mycobacterium TaxID=2642494 RepID=UPI0029C6A26B|nr:MULTISPECIES: TetR/AcrR family transcriptional regulator [unclassified Mycobacterium]